MVRQQTTTIDHVDGKGDAVLITYADTVIQSGFAGFEQPDPSGEWIL